MCTATKPLSDFSPNRANKDGVQSYCKACNNMLSAYRRVLAPEARRAIALKYKAKPENKAKIRAHCNAWHKAHPEVGRLARKRWSERNAHRVRAWTRERQLKKRRAMPAWADRFLIAEAYDLARRRTAATGFKWHVDHVIPLKNDLVCGLHVEHNLSVIPGSQNIRKFNHFEIA